MKAVNQVVPGTGTRSRIIWVAPVKSQESLEVAEKAEEEEM